MNEYEEIREAIDIYLMKRINYHLSLVSLTSDNIVTTRKNSQIDLYLRIRRIESLFPPDCLIIARISFKKERAVRFLAEIALKYGYRNIGIESTNEKSSSFAQKLGFQSIDGSNYVITIDSLIDYFHEKN